MEERVRPGRFAILIRQSYFFAVLMLQRVGHCAISGTQLVYLHEHLRVCMAEARSGMSSTWAVSSDFPPHRGLFNAEK